MRPKWCWARRRRSTGPRANRVSFPNRQSLLPILPIRQISPVCADANPSGATAPRGRVYCHAAIAPRRGFPVVAGPCCRRLTGKGQGAKKPEIHGGACVPPKVVPVPRACRAPTKGPARASSRQHAEVECTALVAKTRCQDRRRGSISAYGAANSGDRTGTGGLKAGMQRPVPPAAKTCANWHEPCSSGGWYQTPTAG